MGQHALEDQSYYRIIVLVYQYQAGVLDVLLLPLACALLWAGDALTAGVAAEVLLFGPLVAPLPSPPASVRPR
jgi:hypothetical protein